MAFKTEAERLAYEAEMQSYHKGCNRLYENNRNNGNTKSAPIRTEADRLMAYQDSRDGASGLFFVIIGFPLLIFPPLGISLIAAGLAMLGYGLKRGLDADAK